MNQTGSSVFFLIFSQHLTDTQIFPRALDNIINYILAIILLRLKSCHILPTYKVQSS